jgi:hypothetical protein
MAVVAFAGGESARGAGALGTYLDLGLVGLLATGISLMATRIIRTLNALGESSKASLGAKATLAAATPLLLLTLLTLRFSPAGGIPVLSNVVVATWIGLFVGYVAGSYFLLPSKAAPI